MKKFTALLLCVAMLMVGVVAQAESGYVYIKTLMKEGLSLQPDISEKLDGTNEEKLLVVLFDIQKQNVFLAGDNLWGTYEGTLWNMEPANFLALFTTFCNMYSSLESLQIKSQAPNGTCCKEIWQKVGRKKCSTNKPPQSAGLKREKRK